MDGFMGENLAVWFPAKLSSHSNSQRHPGFGDRGTDHEFEVGCHISNFHMHIRRYARPTEQSRHLAASCLLLLLRVCNEPCSFD